MTVLRMTAFGGSLPVQSDRMLQDNFAVEAVNTQLYSGELRGIRTPLDLTSINITTRKVFRIPKGTSGAQFPGVVPPPSYLGDSLWMQFSDPDTDIIKGPLVNDSFKRFYWCSPTGGPKVNTYARLLTGDGAYDLGVPGPAAAVGGSASGGTLPDISRVYLVTWKNIWGEEGQPSPPFTLTCKPDGTVNLTGLPQPSISEQGNYATITHCVIYRSITAASGTTTYFKVDEVALGTSTYADTKLDKDITGNLKLYSTSYAVPPSDMEGVVAMPNGFFIGWKGSTIYVSEAYRPHGWPPEYQISVEYDVVGMGVVGNVCVVATEGFPVTLIGNSPEGIAMTKVSVMEPCLSRGSVVSSLDGVYYAGVNGLIRVGPEGLSNITREIITRDEWNQDYFPQYQRAVRYQNGYLCLINAPNQTPTGFFLDPSDARVALTKFSDLGTIYNVQSDVFSGEVFLIKIDGLNGKVQQWDAPEQARFPYSWKSKEFQLPMPENLGAGMIFWNDNDWSVTPSGVAILPTDQKVQMKVWADGTLVATLNIPKNQTMFRLPAGFKATVWQFQVNSRVPISAINIATSPKDLQRV